MNKATETNRIMRSLGFADDECGGYISFLRARVSKMLAKGERIAAVPRNVENLNNEARAKQILALLDGRIE